MVENGQRALAGFLDGIGIYQLLRYKTLVQDRCNDNKKLTRLEPRTGQPTLGSSPASNVKVIAPAFTVQFQPKAQCNGDVCLPKASSSNLASGAQWSDLTEEGTVVVIQQPEGQKCAVLGGIHAINIDRRKAKGIVVSGRIRDMEELRKLETPVRGESGKQSDQHVTYDP